MEREIAGLVSSFVVFEPISSLLSLLLLLDLSQQTQY